MQIAFLHIEQGRKTSEKQGYSKDSFKNEL